MSKLPIAGWVMSVLFVAFMLFSASGKLVFDWETKEEDFSKLGYTVELLKTIGIVEVIIAVLFLVPQTAFVAAILLSAYLGGATSTHVRVGDPYWFPILLGVFMWVAYGFRRPEIFKLAMGKSIGNATKPPAEM